jgi:hypothetical protein
MAILETKAASIVHTNNLIVALLVKLLLLPFNIAETVDSTIETALVEDKAKLLLKLDLTSFRYSILTFVSHPFLVFRDINS